MTLGDPKTTAAERLRSEGGSNLKPRLSSRVSLSLEIASEVGLEKTKEIRSHCQSCYHHACLYPSRPCTMKSTPLSLVLQVCGNLKT